MVLRSPGLQSWAPWPSEQLPAVFPPETSAILALIPFFESSFPALCS